MSRAALIDTASNVVINVVVIEADVDYDPGGGLTVLPVDDDDLVATGWSWVEGQGFVEPDPIEQPPPLTDAERLAALEATVDTLVLDQLLGGLS